MTAADDRHRLVLKLFLDARDRDTADLKEFLDKACGDDDELKAEVHALMQHAAVAEEEGFLDFPIPFRSTGLTETASANKSDSEHSEGAHELIDVGATDTESVTLPEKFANVTEAGSGTMGVVYRARHRSLDVDVAIKVLRRECSIARFLREARILANIDSPHVVAVRDYDTLPDGRPMIVMQWIDGCSLEQKMEASNGRIAEATALSWMKDVCLGMIAAAEGGITHRDLKPSNILIDSNGKARVADFGLALPSESSMNLSASRHVMGTAYYMAPEQAEDPRGVDTRADVYSFGATFYHVLTGVPPFDGPTAVSVLFKHKTEPLVSPGALNPELSEPTRQLLERCLAKNPLDRFQSFRELLSFFESAPWHVTDDDILDSYIRRYNSLRESYFNEFASPGVQDVFRFPNGRTLTILVGDLTEQEVDAIVNSCDGRLEMDYGVSAAIRRSGGQSILAEVRPFAPVRAGRAVVTSAGSLKARFVIHGITVGGRRVSRNLISEVLASCFYHADTFDLSSLAFPLLGTGAGGFEEDVCLDVMFKSLARTLLRGVTTVQNIRIVIYRPEPEIGATVSFQPEVDLSVSLPDHPTIQFSKDSTTHSGIQMASEPFDERSLYQFGYQFAEYFRPAQRITAVGRAAVRLSDGRIAVCLVDASGKGALASMLLQEVLIRTPTALALENTLEGAVAYLNSQLIALRAERFVSALFLALDPVNHELNIVSAGMRPPLLRNADGTIEELGRPAVGFPLGIVEEATYDPVKHTMEVADLIFLHNDAVAEAIDSRNEMYGFDRVRRRLIDVDQPDVLIDFIVKDLRHFTAVPPQDDVCLICLARSEVTAM